MRRMPVKTMFLLVETGAAVSMLVLTFLLSTVTGQGGVLPAGVVLTACALAWLFLLTQLFAKRLSQFTSGLCQTMDSMITGGQEPARAEDRETIFARISYRLSRLYGILQENRRKVDEERRELQTLVSDISHQVKTPVANLKMVTDTLLAKPVTEQERRDFLQGIRSQTDKLEFLVQSMGKASRLETGAITLEKKDVPLLDTLAQAMSGIVYGAEQRGISVEVYYVGITLLVTLTLGTACSLVVCQVFDRIGMFGTLTYHFPALQVLLFAAALLLVQGVFSACAVRNTRRLSLVERIKAVD